EAIAKYSHELAKAKKQPPPPPTADDDSENDNNANATGEDELDEDFAPVKAKKSADVEDSIAKIQAMDAMESEVDRINEIAKIADAHNAGPLRKRAVQATIDALEQDIDRVEKLGGGGDYAPFNRQVVSYPHGQGETVLQSNR